MGKYVLHIEVFEEGEYIIDHDAYEADSEEEAVRLGSEDYCGSTVVTRCTCRAAARLRREEGVRA